MYGESICYHNLAKTGTTIKYVNEILDEIVTIKPDIIVIMYGSVDAQIRANLWKNKYKICDFIPKRYHGGGMLEPRAVYSKKWYRYFPDRIDNINRCFIKKIVLATQGRIQWITDKDFSRIYSDTILSLREITQRIVLVSTVYIDDRYFLNSSQEYEKFNTIIEKLASDNKFEFVDIYSEMRNTVNAEGWDSIYLKDHFHPNKKGYQLIAKKISNALSIIRQEDECD